MNSSYTYNKQLGDWSWSDLWDWQPGVISVDDVAEINEAWYDSQSLNASHVIGNKLKIEKDTVAYKNGLPPGNEIIHISKGIITEPVYSWLTDDKGNLWWMIGWYNPIYIKHDPDALELVPYEGGAKYIPGHETDNGGALFDFTGPGLGKLDDILRKALLIGGIAVGGYFLMPFLPLLKDGVETIADSFKKDE